MMQVIERLASTVTKPLSSDLFVCIKRKMFGQDHSLAYSQLPDTKAFANTARSNVKRVLPLHSRMSPHGAPQGHPLKETVQKLTEKPARLQ